MPPARNNDECSGRTRCYPPFALGWGAIPRGGGISEKAHEQHDQQHDQQHSTSSTATTQTESNPHPQSQSPHQQQRASMPPIPLTSLPLIDTKTVSLALRLTCEANRRLFHGTSSYSSGAAGDAVKPNSRAAAAAANPTATSSGSLQPHHPTGSMMQQTHHMQQQRRKEEMTIFHSTELWKGPEVGGDDDDVPAHGMKSTDAAGDDGAPEKSDAKHHSRWGPDVHAYLNKLLSAIDLPTESTPPPPHASNKHPPSLSPMEDEAQIILALTVLYLDRSASADASEVDPATGAPWGCPPCPQLMPRTLHRMALTAVTIAVKCLRGGDDGRIIGNTLREAANSMLSGGDNNKNDNGNSNGNDDKWKCTISEGDLDRMENWMVHALAASNGMHQQQQQHGHHHEMINLWQIVTQDEIESFLRKWGATFYPRRLAAQDQARMKQMENNRSFWGNSGGVGGGSGVNNRDQGPGGFGSAAAAHGHGNYWPERSATEHDGPGAALRPNGSTAEGGYPPPNHDVYHHYHDSQHGSHGHIPQQPQQQQLQYYEELGSEPF